MEIIIKDLKKTFGDKTAVDIPDLTIHSGELLGLVGNNGAGKSTLFRLILDLIKADTGTVRMKGARSKGQGAGEHQQTPTNLLPLAPCPSPLEIDINVATTEDWKDWTGAFVDESFLIDYLTPDEYFQFIARLTDTSDEQLQEFLARFQHFMADELGHHGCHVAASAGAHPRRALQLP